MSGIHGWARDKSLRFFYRFGIHCATHQIRLILISGLVITSLFYPALGIYSNSISSALPNFSSQLLTSLFASNVRSLLFFEDDLVNVWSDYSALRTTEDPVARARCGMEKTVRVERVLISSNALDFDSGVITHRTLLSALQLEKGIEAGIEDGNLDCLTSSDGSCLHISPLDLWNHNEQTLLSDTDLIATVNSDNEVTVKGLQVKSSMVLAGRESGDTHGSSTDFATYLALTYFFNEDDCNGSTGHNAWVKVLQQVSEGSDLSMNPQEPLFSTLEFIAEAKRPQRVSLITVTLYLSYIIFFVFFSGSMRRMDTVHSRIGLCFTGLVEILVSTITSLSVCAIGGLRITLVPWGIFPIVIVFVGAENMFRLVDEVVNTKISLPVKERIGIGLSRAGTSNTMKVVTYNTILGVIAFFAQGSIRQFCVFAIVVLVAHWFLIHTFFVAVLSIDIQRLELGDLLRQDIALGSSGKRENGTSDSNSKKSPLGKTMGGLRKVANGRVARNVSLLLLLVITATLYYSTLPSTTRQKDEPISRASILRSKAEQALFESHSDAHQIWRIFNPDNDPLVHLRIEYPVLITLDLKHNNASNASRRSSHRPRLSRTFRVVTWITKVLVLPIGITLTCLYGLLLYLLKGTDRLEMRRDHEESQTDTETSPIDGHALFKTLPLVFKTDVAHLASSADGSMIASISTDGELFVWLAEFQSFCKIELRALTLRCFPNSYGSCPVSAVAVDEHGTTCVVGTTAGEIGVWYLNGGILKPLPFLYLRECSQPVTQLSVCRSYGTLTSESEVSNPSDQVPGGPIRIFAVYENNRIIEWVDGVQTNWQPSCTNVVKAQLASVHEVSYPLCLFLTADGGLEVLDVNCSILHKGSVILHAGDARDTVIDAHISVVKVEDIEHALVVAVTCSGMITIWDGNTGELIHSLEDGYGPVNNIQVIPMTPKACSQCGEEPLCAFTLVHSVGHIVSVDRGMLTRRCSCPMTQPMTSKLNSVKDSPMGRRSRSGSFVSSSGIDTSLKTRSRHTSVSYDSPSSDVSAFPVSGHGIHSRRGSERDLRRASERLEKLGSQPLEENGDTDERRSLCVPEASRRMSSASDTVISSVWRNFRMVRLRETTCERGGWGLLDQKILGLRRKPRSRQSQARDPNPRPQSLSSAVLDRWEAWVMDPATTDASMQASSLSSFRRLDNHAYLLGTDNESRHLSRLAFTRLFPLVVKDSLAVAGFGNSVGVLDFSSM